LEQPPVYMDDNLLLTGMPTLPCDFFRGALWPLISKTSFLSRRSFHPIHKWMGTFDMIFHTLSLDHWNSKNPKMGIWQPARIPLAQGKRDGHWKSECSPSHTGNTARTLRALWRSTLGSVRVLMMTVLPRQGHDGYPVDGAKWGRDILETIFWIKISKLGIVVADPWDCLVLNDSQHEVEW
jgi:hypothetical protein